MAKKPAKKSSRSKSRASTVAPVTTVATRTSARSTISGPTRKTISEDATSASTTKIAGIEAVVAAFPFNSAKPTEFGTDSQNPATGQTVEPPHPMVSGSTLTERNASAKVGKGNPQLSLNPSNGSLDRVRVDSGGCPLTTNQGVKVSDNQNSLKAGLRGPALLEDFILREKITHFDHERIPERVAHARGSGAHGYFECYQSLAQLTRASIFAEAGKRTWICWHARASRLSCPQAMSILGCSTTIPNRLAMRSTPSSSP
jgi:catalase